MSVTVYPSTVSPSSVITRNTASDPRTLLQRSCSQVFQKCGEIFQSSFTASSSDVSAAERLASIDLSKLTILPRRNGFVHTAVEAYNQHHHLVIRPDDVWIAILTQFNLYVNANAEMLRRCFVSHEGKKHLVVKALGTRYTIDFGKMALQMGNLIQENVKDPELREWIIPDFSTTTVNDRIVSSAIMMATLKSYFSYEFSLACGLPAVTLLGVRADWEKLRMKAEKLASYGAATAKWHTLLKPVLSAFVRSFDEPDSDGTKSFWQSIAHYSGGGSGPTWLSGWITAFCFFGKEGSVLYSERGMDRGLGHFILDGVQYHQVDTGRIPPAYAETDVKLDDNGKEFQTIMVAGLVGMEIASSGSGVVNDTVKPVSGWWLFEEIDEKQSDEKRLDTFYPVREL